ncbi:MAG: 30S ribosomal protein S18 [Caldilinea sp.]
MSDQTTPTPELEETGSSVAESVVKPTAPSTPPPAPPIFADDDIDEDIDDDSIDDDSFDDDVNEDDEDEGFTAPAQYVEREGSGRPRRIGSDVRIDEIDYKNIGLLSRFLDRRGRILSRRKTRVSAKVQRKIVREIKRARHLALLPYTADQTRIVRKRK